MKTCTRILLVSLGLLALTLSTATRAGVNVKNGNFFITYTDVQWDDKNGISRTYNSRTTFSGIFGYGWSSPLEHTLRVTGTGDIEFVHNGGGKQEKFTRANTSSDVPTWVDAYGNAVTRDEGGFTVLWKRNGRRYRFDLDGRLLLTEDKSGVRSRLTYKHGVIDTIVLSEKHHIKVQFYANGKIRSLQPEKGRATFYSYSVTDDLLVSEDAAQNRFVFEYDRKHNLTAIRYADGASRVLAYNSKDMLVSENREGGCSVRLGYGTNKSAPRAHYWTYKHEVCDGKVKSRYVAEYDYRQRGTGGGSVIRYWFVPRNYRGQALRDVQHQELKYNGRGMLTARNNRKVSDLPALTFDNPLQ